MFENKLINGIHATRYIMSWVRACGSMKLPKGNANFEDWLRQLTINGRALTDEEVDHILYISRNGKMELEMNAKGFYEENIQTTEA